MLKLGKKLENLKKYLECCVIKLENCQKRNWERYSEGDTNPLASRADLSPGKNHRKRASTDCIRAIGWLIRASFSGRTVRFFKRHFTNRFTARSSDFRWVSTVEPLPDRRQIAIGC